MKKIINTIAKFFMSELQYHRFTTRRTALKAVPYLDADSYLEDGWEIAEEEDYNYIPGIVYLEKREKK